MLRASAGSQRGLRSPGQEQAISGVAQVVTYSQPQYLPASGSAPQRTLPAGTYLVQSTGNATVYRPVLDGAATTVPAAAPDAGSPSMAAVPSGADAAALSAGAPAPAPDASGPAAAASPSEAEAPSSGPAPAPAPGYAAAAPDASAAAAAPLPAVAIAAAPTDAPSPAAELAAPVAGAR